MKPRRYRSKSLATWIAVLGGSLGLHRFYLHGLRDPLGWLHPLPIPPDWEDSFRHALRELGYVEGKNIHIEYRLGGGIERLPAMAAELVQLNLDVLIAGNSVASSLVICCSSSPSICRSTSESPAGTFGCSRCTASTFRDSAISSGRAWRCASW